MRSSLSHATISDIFCSLLQAATYVDNLALRRWLSTSKLSVALLHRHFKDNADPLERTVSVTTLEQLLTVERDLLRSSMAKSWTLLKVDNGPEAVRDVCTDRKAAR